MSEVGIGDPVILDNVSGLKKYGYTKGTKGFANTVVTVPDGEGGEQTYALFHADGFTQMHYIDVGRLSVDEERKAQIKQEEDSTNA